MTTLRGRIIALHESQWGPWWISGFVGLLLIAAAAFGGLIQNYLSGEEFLVYHYASNFTHVEAWRQFFLQNGRLVEAFFWTYQYELIGYQPLLLHAMSFVLLLILALVSTACFLNVWPKEKRSRELPYLFIFLIFLNWIFTSTVLRLSYDNGRLSMIFFFLAGLALQRWAREQRKRWWMLSYGFFMLSVFTYENAAFLFPALVLLAWPLLPVERRTTWRQRIKTCLTLTLPSGLILLVPYWLYGFIRRAEVGSMATPVRDFAVTDIFAQLTQSASVVYPGFGQSLSFELGHMNWLVAIGLLLVLVTASNWMFNLHRGALAEISSDTKARWTCIYLAALWFLVFGPLPYVLLGFGAGARVYSSAIFGVFILLLMIYETARQRLIHWITILLMVVFAGLGLLVLAQESARTNQGEAVENIFYRGLKEAVPHVHSGTVFLIIDGPLGNAGCGPSLEVLYTKPGLRCALLSSTYDKYELIRGEVISVADGQRLRGENWVVVLVEDGNVWLLDQIEPGDFDVNISWESLEPIKTNSELIATDSLPLPSPFYLHLQMRAEILFPDQ